MWDFPLFPEQASTVAGRVDSLYFFLVTITIVFSLLIAFAIAFFAIKYRRGNNVDRSNPLSESKTMEAVWIGVPLVIVMIIFFWGTNVYFTIVRAPKQAEDVYATGKQWMWKFQHIGGQREINELHVPVGKPIRVIMTSEDVIHSLYFPSFRVKQDVLPGRYTQLWFEPNKPGTYHIFCAEYCGLQHSGMIGRVVVMDPVSYQRWLSTGKGGGGSTTGDAGTGSGESMASAGEKIFQQQGCASCHMADDATRAPQLKGLFGTQVALKNGETITADEQYIRESILRSGAKIVEGYEPVMPVYQGRISEEDLMQLLVYVKSLAAPAKNQSGGTQSATVPGTATGEQARGTAQHADVPAANAKSGSK
ncbi:MAG: cytochrome c oxidase, subunit [Chlorobi bacterium]|nr:cytochrome c oxidase, subunit [Chlorobiota bacterium]